MVHAIQEFTARQAIIEARRIVDEFTEATWPEDEWIAMGPYWDLNLSTQGISQDATLYPVTDGLTFTGYPMQIL